MTTRLRAALVVVLGLVVAMSCSAEASRPMTGAVGQAPAPEVTSSARTSGAAPSVQIGAHPKLVSSRTTATFTFSANRPAARYACSLDGDAYAACRSPKTYRNLSGGRHTFAVTATIRGRATAPARFAWTVALVPTVEIDAVPSGPPFTSLEATFTFSSDQANATFRCSLDGASFERCTSPKTYGQLAADHHVFAVTASAYGRTSAPARFEWAIALRPGGDGNPPALAGATTIDQVEQYLDGFFAQYGMAVWTGDNQPSSFAQRWLSWTALSESDLPALKGYAAALVDEWGKYPQDWVRVTRTRGVVLVRDLVAGSAGFGTTRRAASFDVEDSLMFYDVNYGTGDYARSVIHHEFEHLVEFNLRRFGPDPTWLSLNPPGFQYGNGGASCYVAGNTCLSGPHPVPGFVSGYATSAMEEDKAEVFSFLMYTSYYSLLTSWITTDSYLAAKIAHFKQYLCSLSAAMCGSYFEAIHRR